jgi:tyrosine-protein kinase Etk/Wzc
VTLVEAGAPSGTKATLHGAEPEPGLSEVLAGQAERSAAMRRGVDKNLLFVPAGKRPLGPGDLGREKSRELLGWLGQGRDFLLVDAPPILLHPEAHPLLWEVDQVVVVLEVGRSRKDRARALLKALAGAGTPVLGCVLNRYEPELPAWIGGAHLP